MERAVTWGDIASIAGWGLLGIVALIIVGIVLVIIFAAIGGFNDWSH